MNEMDLAADRACESLPEDLAEWSAEELVAWLRENYRAAGYKRLCRSLLKRAA